MEIKQPDRRLETFQIVGSAVFIVFVRMAGSMAQAASASRQPWRKLLDEQQEAAVR